MDRSPQSAGHRPRLAVQAFALAAVLVALVGGLFWSQQRAQADQAGAQRLAAHSAQVLAQVDRIRGDALDAAVGVRAYGATRRARFLAPYRRAQRDTGRDLAALRRLVADNPRQTRAARSVTAAVGGYVTGFAGSFAARLPDWDRAELVASIADGERRMTTVRAGLADFTRTELALAAARRRRLAHESRAVHTVAVLGAVAGLLVVLALLAYLLHAVVAPVRRMTDAAGRLAAGERAIELPTGGPAELMRLRGALLHLTGELEVRERDAAAQRRFLGTVLEHLRDAVIACDAGGRVTLLSSAARELYGLAPGELPGRWGAGGGGGPELLLPDGSRPLQEDELPLARALREGAVQDLEWLVAGGPAGEAPRRMRSDGCVLRDGRGAVIGVVLATRDVTVDWAQRQALQDSERRARAAEERWNRTLDQSPLGLAFQDLDRRLEGVNPAFAAMLGYGEDELVGMCVDDLADPEDAAAAAATARALRRDGGARQELRRWRHRDGSTVHTTASLTSVRDEAGRHIGVFGSYEDMTARVEAEAALRASQERYRRVVDSVGEVVFEAGLNGRWKLLNDAWERHTGFAVDASVGRPVFEHVPPEDRPALRSAFAGLVAAGPGGEPLRVTHRFHTAAGELRWAEVEARLVTGADGEPVVAGSHRDVTVQRRAREQERAHLENLRAIAGVSRRLSGDGDARAGVCEAALTVSGATFAALLEPDGGTWLASTGMAGAAAGPLRVDVAGERSGAAIAFDTGEPFFAADAAGHPAISQRFVELLGARSVLHQPVLRDGVPVGVISVTWAHRVAELSDQAATAVALLADEAAVAIERADLLERLDAERRRFRGAFDHAPIGVALVRSPALAGGTIEQVNPALCALTGAAEDELVGGGLHDLVHPDDVEAVVMAVAELADSEASSGSVECRVQALGDDDMWAVLSVSLVRSRGDRVEQLIVQVLDISARKRDEAQLRFLADHDALSGLKNRRRFEEDLRAQLAHHRRYGRTGAVLVMDLDRFKHINDTLGHAAGDEAIAAAARVLRERLRSTDTVARLGGDEFAAVLPETDLAGARAAAAGIAAQLRGVVVGRGGDGEPIALSGSIGIAEFGLGSHASWSPDAVLAEADAAMYAAKHDVRATV